MRNSGLAAALCGMSALAPISTAWAAANVFTGTATATASVAMDSTCQPFSAFRGTILPSNSSGFSNLGNFTYQHSVCTQGAVTPISLQSGTFSIFFNNGSINGTLTGSSTPRSGSPGVFDQVFDYIIDGGTGTFAKASGAFSNVGTVDISQGPPSRLAFSFDGVINAPVPEPAAWALMILGFGAIGSAQRITRRQSRAAIA